jgi:hypothetical protein
MITSTLTQIAAQVSAPRLDRALRDGTDPASSRLLGARAAHLTGRPARERIAGALERLAASPDRPRVPGRFARVTPSLAAAYANRDELLQLAGILRAQAPLGAQGVAELEEVVTDGAGPAYTDARGDVLAGRLRLAHAHLHTA